MNTAAVILADETSKTFPDDKGLMQLGNKALIRHVYDIINPLVEEVIIVTNTSESADKYAKLLPKTIKFIVNNQQKYNPLNSAITGFTTAQSTYTLLILSDAPLINKNLASFLIDIALGKMAVVPRNADQEIEPLCAVYQTKPVLETAKQAAAEGAEDLQTLIEKLKGVRYISHSVIEQIDPGLLSFFSVNTPGDLKRATAMFEGKQKQQTKPSKNTKKRS
jgi:molybdopterin-guanine dinucleotide biosynthesis protein A